MKDLLKIARPLEHTAMEVLNSIEEDNYKLIPEVSTISKKMFLTYLFYYELNSPKIGKVSSVEFRDHQFCYVCLQTTVRKLCILIIDVNK